MGANSKANRVRGTVRKRAVKPPGGRGRRAKTTHEPWEWAAEVPEERDAALDCQRIVTENGGRNLPLYHNDYN